MRGVGARGVAPPAGRASWLLAPAYAVGIHRRASASVCMEPWNLRPQSEGGVGGEEGTSRLKVDVLSGRGSGAMAPGVPFFSAAGFFHSHLDRLSIHFLSGHLWSAYSMPGSALGRWGNQENKIA